MDAAATGGGDSNSVTTPVETVQGTVYYTNGDWMGVVNSDSLSSSGRYDILDTNGNKVGEIDTDGLVYDTQGNEMDLCVGEVAYSTEGKLVGECIIVDDGRASQADDPVPAENKADEKKAVAPAGNPAPAECCDTQNECCDTPHECCDTPNTPPKANPDNVSTPHNTSILIDVLANDTDLEGPVFLTGLIENEVGGTFVIDGNKIRYTPTNGHEGSATSQYEIEDQGGLTAKAKITVEVGKAAPPVVSTPTILMNDQVVDDWAGGVATDMTMILIEDVETDAVYSIVGNPEPGKLTINASTGVATWLGESTTNGGDDYVITIKVVNPDGGTDSTTFNLHVNDNA